MKDLLQRLKGSAGRSAAGSAPARLTLAAFGKHPGWDDHIEGLGLETETLAQLKQVLYVGGIGGQIDAGAWEKLEPEKRLPGFDHTFLWLRPGHVLLGQFWSSTDGKGRGKYPMVLCVDGEGVTAGFLLKFLVPGLERLREACKRTTSAEQVAKDCRNGQDQLRAMLAQDAAKLADPGAPLGIRQRFLQHPQLGPDRLGLLRALHELRAAPSVAPGARGSGGSVRSSYVRLPLAADSASEGLILWSSFLRGVVPEVVPLLLIARTGENWFDVLIGEPGPNDFFCLQASPKALPLATEIPYEVAADLSGRLLELEQKFLGTEPAVAARVVPAASVTLPLSAPPSSNKPSSISSVSPGVTRSEPARPVSPESTAAVPAPASPPPSTPRAEAPQLVRIKNEAAPRSAPAGERKPASGFRFPFWLAAVIIAAGAAVWFFARPHHPAPAAPASKASPAAAETNEASAPTQPVPAVAVSEPDTPAQQKYKTATNAASLAILQMNYSEASNQAGLALAVKPGDAAALKLMNEANQAIASAATRVQQQSYQTATNAAALDLAQGRYQEATNQASIALSIKPGDPDATQVFLAARAALQQQAAFVAATNAAAAALVRANYREATNQAVIALNIVSNDPVALQLKGRADEAMDLAAARDYLDRGEYDKAASLCASHAGVAQFQSLTNQIAAEQNALARAHSSLAAGDYGFLDALKNETYGEKPVFASLISQAGREKATLDSLQLLKQTNGWQEVTNRFADPSLAPLLSKKPFAELRTWALAQASAPVSAKDQRSLSLDKQLEVLLVQFRVLKQNAPELQTDAGRQAKPTDGALDNPGYYLGLLDTLEKAYTDAGLLDSNRRKYLADLRQAINLR